MCSGGDLEGFSQGIRGLAGLVSPSKPGSAGKVLKKGGFGVLGGNLGFPPWDRRADVGSGR